MSQVIALLEQVRQEMEEQPPLWPEIVRTRLKEFFILIRRTALRPVSAPSPVNLLMKQLLAYLDQNFMLPLSLPQLSRHFGFSTFYLSRCFSQFSGLGIKRYIMQRRIAEAQLIMEKHSNLKLTAVAEQLGFKNYAVFNRAFLKISHIPPSAFRH